MDKIKFSNYFSVSWALEEVGTVVMLIVPLCNLLKDILPGTEVLDDCECWPNWYLCIMYWSFGLLKTFKIA